MSELAFDIEVVRGEFKLVAKGACPPGITCIIGPSGSGKSTLLATLAGLATPDRGRVAVGSEVWLDRARGIDVPVHQRRQSYVFQGLALFPHMTALGNVEYGMHDVARPERTERALKLLERVGVKHLARRKPRTFSGGEAQRVAIARALARSPKLVLLDEPFSALDRELRAQLTGLVRDLSAELGVPIVHVTHSLGEVKQLADHVIRFEKGAIVERGTPDQVLASLPID
ncbi:MAG: ATP-binding cassette domain-containing protein [Deltaproteobacteria bacterium]|nr:ATP-binding cassette domain-containing protein [Deltaproteobacteria bacterium]